MFGSQQHYINCASSSGRHLSVVYPMLSPEDRVSDPMVNCGGVCVRVNNNKNWVCLTLSRIPCWNVHGILPKPSMPAVV